jgi:bifunctional N-acetylglucosamine-1-phosphate-uridyltransferase/glucosamine-1-phosphate-acetyltransferase GlmU-like protein
MLLHEIITANENPKTAILIEKLIPYKKSLHIYYSNYSNHGDEPLLMVTAVMNAAQYGRIVSSNELTEAICEYLDDYDCMEETSENFGEYETICFNSILLKTL